jgi:cysteine desulfurase
VAAAEARPLYLDWNATTPLAPEAREAMSAALEDGWANPASVHAAGRRARAHVEDARQAVASLLGFDPRDVLFTSGGTEANNVALRSFVGPGDGLVTSRLEHPSVVRTADALAAAGAQVVWIEPAADGLIEVPRVLEAITALGASARLVSLQAVNHETGVLQPVRALADALGALGGPRVLVHSDAVQAVGRLPPAAWGGADIVTIASHKIRGPKGAGAVAARPGLKLVGLLKGGEQERGVRPGTQDPVVLSGFGAAARRAAAGPDRYATLAALRDTLEATLVGAGAVRNGGEPRAPHVTNLSFSGWLGPELCAALDLEGLCVSSGSACSAGTAEPSPVITAMLGRARAASAVRISLGETSNRAEMSAAAQIFLRVLARS